MSSLVYLERPAAGEPRGLLILHHGRGADEQDLLPLADVLDPRRRLHVITPRAPLNVDGSPGAHWYRVPRVGYPDPTSFHDAFARLAAFHEEQFARLGLPAEQTILGGFSMGAVMSYALGLGGDRPAPAGILALSGFIPTVEGWEPELASRAHTCVFIAHGRRDQVIDFAFAQRAYARLEPSPLAVEFHPSEAAHHIDPRQLPDAQSWIADTVAAASSLPRVE